MPRISPMLFSSFPPMRNRAKGPGRAHRDHVPDEQPSLGEPVIQFLPITRWFILSTKIFPTTEASHAVRKKVFDRPSGHLYNCGHPRTTSAGDAGSLT